MRLHRRVLFVVVASAGLVGCGLAVTGSLDVGGDGGTPSAEAGTPQPDAAGDDDATVSPDDDGGGADGASDAGADVDASDAGGDADAACPTAATVDAGVLAVYPIAAVNLDGTLSEWGCVPFVSVDKDTAARIVGASPSTATLSAQFALAYDAQYLYFAGKIGDTITGSSTVEPYRNDSVELYLDGDGTLTGLYGANDHQYVVDHKLFIRDYGPEPPVTPASASFQAAVTKPGGGWIVEARIAWTALGGTATVGRRVGFDVGFVNGDGTQQVQMLYWFYSSNTAASCTPTANVCCGAGSEPWCDTRRFGLAELRP